jgi:AcrR family transcriptional regulator
MTADSAKFQRRQPKQSRARATWEAIVEAASQILDRHGPRAFNTGRVAERAGVSIGTLYQYFPDKLAILAEVMRREFGDGLSGRRGAVLTALVAAIDTRPAAKPRRCRSPLERLCGDVVAEVQAFFQPAPVLQPIPIRARRHRGE